MAGRAEEAQPLAVAEEEEEEEENVAAELGLYKGQVRLVSDYEEEIMMLWAIQQPIFSKNNAFVSQSSLQLRIDACGRSLSILQSPSSLGAPGVTGAVMWDSGIILGKFLEHSVESGTVVLQGKNVVELGSGCGLVGCIAALLGARVILTDLPDRLKLLKKNVETNLYGDIRGSATVNELTWGDDLDKDFTEPLPDFVIGSDVVYSEGAVVDLMETLVELCGKQTTVVLAGELRNGITKGMFIGGGEGGIDSRSTSSRSTPTDVDPGSRGAGSMARSGAKEKKDGMVMAMRYKLNKKKNENAN